MRPRTPAACLALALALSPGVVLAEEIDLTSRELQPVELQASQVASRLVLGAQQEERELARAAGLGALDRDVAELRRALRRLQAAERRVRMPVGPTGRAAASAAQDETRRGESRAQVLAGVSELARRRAAAADGLGELESPTLRRVVEQAVALLEQVEQEAREAVDAPPDERVERLAALEQRLRVERHGLGGTPGGPPTPTLHLLPASELPPLESVDAP
jgi:hypothetical protein